MKTAYFDADGLCYKIGNELDTPVEGGTAYFVDDSAIPDWIWFDGTEAQKSEPCTLEFPSFLRLNEEWLCALPDNTIAVVNGKRIRNVLRLDTTAIGTLFVEIRGAQYGSYIVDVRSYVEERKAAYPLIADQLDALWKGGEHMETMRERIMSVKQEIPKE